MRPHSVPPIEDEFYPSSDGQPMAENDWQLRAIIDAVSELLLYFKHRPDVYVSGDLLIYHEEGNPGARVAPDVFVVFGAARHKRTIYKLWEEPKAPDFVLEVASAGTWKNDLGPKRALYAALGIREYWLFDPREEYFDPPLQGFRLEAGGYRPLPARVEDGKRMLRSEVLGLGLHVQNDNLRFRDPATGEDLRTLEESEANSEQEKTAREKVEADLEQEKTTRGKAEADLEQEKTTREQAEAAREKAEAAREQEQAARRLAETRIAELEARLGASEAGN